MHTRCFRLQSSSECLRYSTRRKTRSHLSSEPPQQRNHRRQETTVGPAARYAGIREPGHNHLVSAAGDFCGLVTSIQSASWEMASCSESSFTTCRISVGTHFVKGIK